ncbi:MAG: pyruvate kinase [Gammaproteobacteria bacterium]|nr:pyruvate kinase [Gammaproteobacteria bacterium]
MRRTKIIATLGPALDDPEVLRRVILAGADVFRANFSHGSHETHAARISMVRKIAAEQDRTVAILADLQGPKIRIARFKNKKILLKEGQTFVLDPTLGNDEGTEETVSLDYKNLPNDVHANDLLLLDDGRIVLRVDKIAQQKIICTVLVEGELSNNKGINRLGGGLSAEALTEKDRIDLIEAVRLEADFIAISFPRDADDIKAARVLLRVAGGNANIIAKIERTEAVKNIEEIIHASDAVMVARGDLGVELGDAELPGVQKLIINLARTLKKPVITATQMLDSMTNNTIPTRAEVSDVANAVLDGTDAVMLSQETAVGKYPDKAVAAMHRICVGAEKNPLAKSSPQRLDFPFTFVDEAIAMATMYTATHLDIRAIIALTESGTTPLWMSRINSEIPIYGLSRHAATLRRMTLYRGVFPIPFDATHVDRRIVNAASAAELQKRGILNQGDLVIITKGDLMGVHGKTNAMKIFTVGNLLAENFPK